jgi:hypothetical protein
MEDDSIRVGFSRIALFVVAATLLAGCYRSHGLMSLDDGSVGTDIPRDLGMDHTVEFGFDTTVDHRDTGRPDLVPDLVFDPVIDPDFDPHTDWAELADPVDWVDTADWGEVDLPDVGDDAPTAVVVGDPIEITDDVYTGCIPVVEWTGSEWGVAWGGWGTPYVFRPLDATGAPIGPITVIDHSTSGLYPAIEWADDRWGFAAQDRGEGVNAGILNDDGAMIHGPAIFPDAGKQPDIIRYEQYQGWVLTFVVTSGGERVVYAAHIDELGRRTGEAQAVGDTDSGYYSPNIVGFGDRASVVWPTSGSIWQRTFSWPFVSGSPSPTELSGSFGMVTDGRLDATSYRDRILIAWLGSGGVRTLAYDPATGMTLHGSVVVGSTGIRDRKPGLAAVHENGYLGLCWETGVGPAGGGSPSYRGDGADFRIIDEDGEPIGAPVTIVSGINNIGGCAVGWSGSQFLVAYWNCGEAGDDYGIWVRRVTPLI